MEELKKKWVIKVKFATGANFLNFKSAPVELYFILY